MPSPELVVATWQAQIDKWIAQLETAMAAYPQADVAQYAYVYGFNVDRAASPGCEANVRRDQGQVPRPADHDDTPG